MPVGCKYQVREYASFGGYYVCLTEPEMAEYQLQHQVNPELSAVILMSIIIIIAGIIFYFLAP